MLAHRHLYNEFPIYPLDSLNVIDRRYSSVHRLFLIIVLLPFVTALTSSWYTVGAQPTGGDVFSSDSSRSFYSSTQMRATDREILVDICMYGYGKHFNECNEQYDLGISTSDRNQCSFVTSIQNWALNWLHMTQAHKELP